MSEAGRSLPPDEGFPEAAMLPADWMDCWRCAKQVPAAATHCPFCEARLSPQAIPAYGSAARGTGSPILPICVAFGALLLVSVLHAGFVALLEDVPGELPMSLRKLRVTLGAESIDTLIVVAALIATMGQVRRADPTLRNPLVAWCCAPFALAAALALNFGYHAALRAFVDWPGTIDTTGFDGRNLALVVLAVCAQPAVVEELFVRYLAIGALRDSMGVHAAVCVSSVMFGMLHVGNPIAIPVLIVLGLVLGYLRIMSGGLALPMLAHFVHNAIILFVDWHLS
jgi:membrane protease YdiL (CAAX protease family)